MGMQLAPWIKNPGWATTWTLGQRSASIYFLDILRFGVTTLYHVLSKTSRFVDEFPIKMWISCQVWLREGIRKLGVEVSRHTSVLACSCRILSGTICCLHVITSPPVKISQEQFSLHMCACAHTVYLRIWPCNDTIRSATFISVIWGSISWFSSTVCVDDWSNWLICHSSRTGGPTINQLCLRFFSRYPSLFAKLRIGSQDV